jgi:UDP-N-acetylglucosamine transferase subunit ALG13
VTFDGRTPTVLVSVGTDHHPFDRLVRWVDGWLGAQTNGKVTVLVQYGASHPPGRARGLAYLDHADLGQVFGGAHVVVCHGGPSTIAEARRNGHHPIVVPRDPMLGEHVDDHQLRFSRRLADAGLVRLATSREELVHALEDALAHAAHAHPENDEPEASKTADSKTADSKTASQPSATEAALRFGALVDDLFAARRR